MTGFIYTLENPATGEVRYVGQTTHPLYRRLASHFHSRRRAVTHLEKWIARLHSEGLKPLIKELEIAEVENLDTLEIFYISLFRSWGFNLVNLDSGGKSRRGISEETRSKLKIAAIDKINRGITGYKRGHTYNVGRKVNEETKKKLSSIKKKLWANKEHHLCKHIILTNIDTSEEIELKSIREVAKFLKVKCMVSIINCCKNRRESYKGYKMRYK